MAPAGLCRTADLSHASDTDSIAGSDVAIEDYLSHVQLHVFRRRMRIKDIFADFDRAHRGRITRQQFERAMKTVCPTLSHSGVASLADHFTESGPHVHKPQVVSYTAFCNAIDEVFYTKGLETQPGLKVPRPGSAVRCAFQRRDVEDLNRLNHILCRIALLTEKRGVRFRHCFMDCDRSNNSTFFLPRHSGKITPAQFSKCFPFTAEFSEEDLKLLMMRYTAEDGSIHFPTLDKDVSQMIPDVHREAEFERPRVRPQSASAIGIAPPATLAATAANVEQPKQRPRSALSRSTQRIVAAQTSAAHCTLERPRSAAALVGRRNASSPASSAPSSVRPVADPEETQRPMDLSGESPVPSDASSGRGMQRLITATSTSSLVANQVEAYKALSTSLPARRPQSAGSRGRQQFGGNVARCKSFAGLPSSQPSGQDAMSRPVTGGLRSRPSTAGRRMEAPPVPPPEVDVITRLRAAVFERRIRLHDRFRDFDRFRRGTCTPGQMRTILSILRLDLTARDYNELVEMYQNQEGNVQYHNLCIDLGDQLSNFDPTPVGGPLRYISGLEEDEKDEFNQIANWIQKRVRLRRMTFRELFQDFGKSQRRAGHVSRAQFARIMDMLGFNLSEKQVDVLCQPYCDTDCGRFVNYMAFCSDMEHRDADQSKALSQGAEPHKAAQKHQYFDAAGRVVPRAC